MINKNLLGLATVVFVSGTAFLTQNNPVVASTHNLQKESNSSSKLFKNFNEEKNKNNELSSAENIRNNYIEQLTGVKSEPVQIAHSAGSGKASWYGPGFHGRLTANGERYNQNAMTAAHRSLPFGTRVRVTNVNNGRSVVVRINDRGPFIRGRVIDVSAAAAHNLGMVHHGVVPVRLQVLR